MKKLSKGIAGFVVIFVFAMIGIGTGRVVGGFYANVFGPRNPNVWDTPGVRVVKYIEAVEKHSDGGKKYWADLIAVDDQENGATCYILLPMKYGSIDVEDAIMDCVPDANVSGD